MEAWINNHITLPVYRNESYEKENALSHFIGLVLALLALSWVISRYSSNASMIVFSLSNIIMQSSSFLYHYLKPGVFKRIMRIMDHSSIYLLIAGSYTPLLIYLGTPLAIGYAIGIWIVAVLGIFFTVRFWGRFYPLHIILYALMGWSILSIWHEVSSLMPLDLIKCLIAGGTIYTTGILFYAFKKIPHNHLIWHIFVLAGSIIFFLGYMRNLL